MIKEYRSLTSKGKVIEGELTENSFQEGVEPVTDPVKQLE